MMVKVCGMRDSQNIHDIAAAGADIIGMIFYEKSPRLVSAVPHIPKHVKRVGVFVNSTAGAIIEKAGAYRLDMVQLHGCESPEYVRKLRPAIAPTRIIKAISVANGDDIGRCEGYEDCVDMFLFDTRCPTMGGSGKQFDWNILHRYHGTRPFLLSGGIGPEDAARIAAFRHPMLAGVDLNSRFETSPAMKDAGAIRTFIKSINKQ